METYVQIDPTQQLDPFKAVKKIPLEEYFTSGHRTCQGCESALVMKMMAKAAGPRTIVLGSTGCMYVANTTYYSTSWVLPWMHTQLGSSGSAALGASAALKVLMRDVHGASVMKLRAFVAGSGDMRRVQTIVSETFTDKKAPIPALSTIQVGGLPLTGAQVVIESIAVDKKVVNPQGLAFFSGQPAASAAQDIATLQANVNAEGVKPAAVLRNL